MHRSGPLAGIIVLALAGSLAAVQAAGAMSERQARTAAAKILKGDPYGNTPTRSRRTSRARNCSPPAPPDAGRK